MDHPSLRSFARYALGELTDEAELAAFEDHLLECADCRRRALAVDLVGTDPNHGEQAPVLHISSSAGGAAEALCGADASRNVISEVLLSGMNLNMVCHRCLTILRGGLRDPGQHIN